MENMTIYDACRSVPETAKKAITAGRLKGKTDINPMWRIKRLTEQFGPCGIGWYYKPVRKWMETHGDEIAAFVDIELYVKSGRCRSLEPAEVCSQRGRKTAFMYRTSVTRWRPRMRSL